MKVCPKCGAKKPQIPQAEYDDIVHEREQLRGGNEQQCIRVKCRDCTYHVLKSAKICPECGARDPQMSRTEHVRKREQLLQIPATYITYRPLQNGDFLFGISGENICKLRNKDTSYMSCTVSANSYMIHQLTKKVDRLQNQMHRIEGLLTEFLDRIEFVPGGEQYTNAQQHFEQSTNIKCEEDTSK